MAPDWWRLAAPCGRAQNNLLIDWLTRKYGPPQSTRAAFPSIGLTTWDWDNPDEIEMNISKGTAAFVMQSKRK